jgi:L-threonylcarbamoyladenylate synthase
MQTLRLKIESSDLNEADSRTSLNTAARILRDGGTVAFPTETVYGLGANALRAGAVEKIFHAKQRPSWDPLIVHISGADMLPLVAANVPPAAKRLINAFWPGPLTLLLPRHQNIPGIVTAGRPRVGVRMPRHPVAQALIQAAGVPIAAPSANTFGHTSPTTAQHVADDLDGRIDAILDAGEELEGTAHGLESTVVDVCESPWIIYRPGVITLEQIREICGDAVAFDEATRDRRAAPSALPSPGVGLRHYAPRARLILVEYGPDQQRRFAEQVAALSAKTLGLMLPDQFAAAAGDTHPLIYRWGDWDRPEQLAQRLFAGLRWLDFQGATTILCPMPAAHGIGIAIRDRLSKAAKTE